MNSINYKLLIFFEQSILVSVNVNGQIVIIFWSFNLMFSFYYITNFFVFKQDLLTEHIFEYVLPRFLWKCCSILSCYFKIGRI